MAATIESISLEEAFGIDGKKFYQIRIVHKDGVVIDGVAISVAQGAPLLHLVDSFRYLADKLEGKDE